MIQTYQIQELRESIALYADHLKYGLDPESADRLSRAMAEVDIEEIPAYLAMNQVETPILSLMHNAGKLIKVITDDIKGARRKDSKALMKLKYCKELRAMFESEFAKIQERMRTEPTREDLEALEELNAFIRGDYDGIMEFDEFMGSIILNDLTVDGIIWRLGQLIANCKDEKISRKLVEIISKTIARKNTIEQIKSNEVEFMQTYRYLLDNHCATRMAGQTLEFIFDPVGYEILLSLYDKIKPHEDVIISILDDSYSGKYRISDQEKPLFNAFIFVIQNYHDKCSAIRDRICGDESQPPAPVEIVAGDASTPDFLHMDSFICECDFDLNGLYSFLKVKGVIKDISQEYLFNCINCARLDLLLKLPGITKSKMKYTFNILKTYYEPKWIEQVCKLSGLPQSKLSGANLGKNKDIKKDFDTELREALKIPQ